MPDLNTTRSELEQAFIAGWGATTPIAFDNSNYTETTGEAYVKVNVEFTGSTNVCIGGALPNSLKQRHSGLFRIAIYTPINLGTGAAYTLADTYKGIMDNKDIVTGLLTGTSDVRRSGEEIDGFWSVICFTSFTSDE